jgi:hypothetical protein
MEFFLKLIAWVLCAPLYWAAYLTKRAWVALKHGWTEHRMRNWTFD